MRDSDRITREWHELNAAASDMDMTDIAADAFEPTNAGKNRYPDILPCMIIHMLYSAALRLYCGRLEVHSIYVRSHLLMQSRTILKCLYYLKIMTILSHLPSKEFPFLSRLKYWINDTHTMRSHIGRIVY